MDVREAYNLIAEDWHRDHQSDVWWVEGTDAFIARLGPGARVLDAGCGGGIEAKYLASRGLGVIGIDNAERMIAIARREAPAAEFRLLDMRDLDRLAETFDGIFAQAAVLHLPKRDVPAFFSRCAEKIRPGGLCYIAVKEKKEGRREEEIVEEDDYGYPYRRFFSYFTLPELEAYFASAGFEIIWKEAKKSGKSVWLSAIGRKPGSA